MTYCQPTIKLGNKISEYSLFCTGCGMTILFGNRLRLLKSSKSSKYTPHVLALGHQSII